MVRCRETGYRFWGPSSCRVAVPLPFELRMACFFRGMFWKQYMGLLFAELLVVRETHANILGAGMGNWLTSAGPFSS